MRKLTSGIGWIVIAGAALLWFSGGNDNPSQSGSSDAATVDVTEDAIEPVESTWVSPADFVDWADGIGYRFVDDPECDFSVCWQIDVVTRDGCPGGVFLTINVLEADVVVDDSIDSLSSLEPEQIGRLTMRISEEGDVRARVTDINCY